MEPHLIGFIFSPGIFCRGDSGFVADVLVVFGVLV